MLKKEVIIIAIFLLIKDHIDYETTFPLFNEIYLKKHKVSNTIISEKFFITNPSRWKIKIVEMLTQIKRKDEKHIFNEITILLTMAEGKN